MINFVNGMHMLVSVLTFPLDMRDKNNQTPLHKSCGSWCFTFDVVQYLIENTNCDVSE